MRIRGLLIDLNGTIHVGSEPTRNAVKALEKLREAKIPFIFCLLSRLQDMGMRAERHELMTSLGACRQLATDRNLRPFLLLSDSAKDEFADLPFLSEGSSEGHDSVILGLDEASLSYGPLNKAFRILKGEPIDSLRSEAGGSDASQNRRPVLIAPHASLFQQSAATDQLPAGLSLGIGPFVKALEVASGLEAELVGKPSKRFFELAISRLREVHGAMLKAEEIAVVGDDIENDLGEGAVALGLERVLVRTGKYRPENEHHNRPPDRIYDDFAAFVDDLIRP